MADLSITLDPPLAADLVRAVDIEGKIPRAIGALGPVADRDVTVLDDGVLRTQQLAALGARVRTARVLDAGTVDAADGSADALVGFWSPFHGGEAEHLAEAQRVVRPGGRLLLVHDYGRDDVSTLRGDRPEYGDWSRRDGPFLRNGFKIRVLHCWWTFPSLEEARGFLAAAFGSGGHELGGRLTRPRVSYNVAIYHRTVGGEAP